MSTVTSIPADTGTDPEVPGNLHRLLTAEAPVRPGGSPGGGLDGMWAVLRQHVSPFAVSCAWGVAHQGLKVAAGVLAAVAVSAALAGAGSGEVLAWTLGAAACVLGTGVAAWLEAAISHKLAFLVLAQVRGWLYRAFARMAPGGLLRHRTGDLASRATADAEGIEMFYAHTLIYVVGAAVVSPVAVGVLAVLHPLLGAAAAGAVGLLVAVPLAVRRRNHRHGARLRRRSAELSTQVADLLEGMPELVGFGAAERQLRVVSGTSEALSRGQLAQSGRIGLENAATAFLGAAGTLTVLATAGWLVGSGRMAATDLPIVLALVVGAGQPVLALLGATRIWGITTASADRVFAVLAEPAVTPEPEPAARHAEVADRPTLEFDGVSHRYGPAEPLALRDLTVTIPFGQLVAIVGHSGAGKSTMAGLALRVHDPTAGAVRLGGVDLRDLPDSRLRGLIAAVPQDVYLFHDSVLDNLVLGRPDAGADAVRRALVDAHASDVVDALPNGLSTVVGERGARLSGGQRQRLALARALLVDTPLLVLDEPVSQLDAASEWHIHSALRRLSGSRTVLVIAHRLSTIRIADRVLVLERGRLVGDGSHAELLDRCPEYHRLVTSQWGSPAVFLSHHEHSRGGDQR